MELKNLNNLSKEGFKSLQKIVFSPSDKIGHSNIFNFETQLLLTGFFKISK